MEDRDFDDAWPAGTTSSIAGGEWLPQIVVKLHDDVEVISVVELGAHLDAHVQAGFAAARPLVHVRRLIDTLNRESIARLIERATREDPGYSPRNLPNYFALVVSPRLDLGALVSFLSSLPSVETAYINLRGEEPQVHPEDDPEFANQGYHKPAPDGVGTELVWPKDNGSGVKGADGTGVNLIDMERGWTLEHNDLIEQDIKLIYGNILNGTREHGTAVLGVVAAKDNTIGVVGMVPNIASVRVVSCAANGSTDRPNALAAAIDKLKFGDVLLIEAQLAGLIPVPIEVLLCEFDMIRAATAAGIIVIEAAGNKVDGGSNLDLYKDSSGHFILNPAAPGFRDSGAILVGAARARYPHARFRTSNFGARVNCFAWGENVVTCLSDSSGSTSGIKRNFGHTSAASAIIAGVAASVQGMTEQNLHHRLNPWQMRAILSDRTTGTLSAGDLAAGGAAVDFIGVMPDLNAISHRALNVRPAHYIRQSIADDGSLPREIRFTTPDIILSPINVFDPQDKFGEGSGTENSDLWGVDLAPGQDAFLYLRARNRGGATTNGTFATIFWSPLSTVLTPEYWQLIGSASFPHIPTGDSLTVSEAIIWPASQRPSEDQYTVIALLSTNDDPVPIPPCFRTWDDYLRFITDNRNVGVRNLNVITYAPAKSRDYPDDQEYVALSFVAPGPPDIGRLMQMEAEARLPEGSKAWMEAPPLLMNPLSAKRNVKSIVWVPINPFGRTALPESLFPANSRAQLRLLVQIPNNGFKARYSVHVRQLYENGEVGRITWKITPY